MQSKLKSGDPEAIQTLQNAVLKVCRSILKRDYEDAAQDAMLRIWKSLDSFNGGSTFLTWVNQIAANVCRREIERRRRREQRYGPLEFDVVEETDEEPPIEDLMEALESLDPRQKQSLQGKLEGKSTDELASELGVTKNHLWQIQFSARQKLKETLQC